MGAKGDGKGAAKKAEKVAAEKIPDDAQKNANPGDTATTKGILDDAVVQSFEDAGFAEDHTLSNLKLFLGALACAFALIAQFYPSPLAPLPFPESRPLLLVCCVLYFFLSFTLQLITSFYEQSWDGQDKILYTLPPCEQSPFWTPLKGHCVQVSTKLARFSTDYSLILEVKNDKGQLIDTAQSVLKLTDYFEENGTFHEDFFMDDVEDLIGSLGTVKKTN
eukprot:Tamp_20564.p1 GENE.Tamp_20564~~Tamp_20564.p1  ORF type:complete len:234 (+),score=63.39 Tamp_20564:43-702(+)